MPPVEQFAERPADSPTGCGPIRRTPTIPAPLRQQVFECIRSAGQIPRVEIAKTLGVSAGSVTAITSELLRGGFVRELTAPASPTPRGRPPVALAVRPERGFVVGMKLAAGLHTAVVVDFSGSPVVEARLPVDPGARSIEEMLDELASLFEDVMEAAGMERDAIAAVGLGLPGVVDPEAGRWIWSPILSGTEVPIRALAEQRLGTQVHVDNDVNLLTLAELWYGAGRGETDFAVVTIEHGVGMGLVIGGQLYRGAHGFGMELGHMKVQFDGALCRCGRRGCLEAYVADYALVREATTALGMHTSSSVAPQVLLESLFDQAKAGNDAARTIFRRAGRYLSVGLANVVSLFDPPLIILSGERMRYDYLYAEETIEEMTRMLIEPRGPDVRVEVHAWGDWVWARGAATLALSAVTTALLAADGQ